MQVSFLEFGFHSFTRFLHFCGCHWESQSILTTTGRRGSGNKDPQILLITAKWPTWYLYNKNRDWILGIHVESRVYLWLQGIWATFARPIAGVSCPRAERRPQPATPTQPYGAMWPMECMSAAATATAAASLAKTSTTCAFMTARRRVDGICWRCLWKKSSAFAWEV